MELDDYKEDLLTPLQQQGVKRLEQMIATGSPAELLDCIREINKELEQAGDSKTWVDTVNSPIVDVLLKCDVTTSNRPKFRTFEIGAKYGVSAITDRFLDDLAFIRNVILSGDIDAFDFVYGKGVDMGLFAGTALEWALEGKSAVILAKVMRLFPPSTRPLKMTVLERVTSPAIAKFLLTECTEYIGDKAKVLEKWAARPKRAEEADFWAFLVEEGVSFDDDDITSDDEQGWLAAMLERAKFHPALVEKWLREAIQDANESLVAVLCGKGGADLKTYTAPVKSLRMYRTCHTYGRRFNPTELMEMLKRIALYGDFEWLEQILKDGYRFPAEAINIVVKGGDDHECRREVITRCTRQCLRLLLDCHTPIPLSLRGDLQSLNPRSDGYAVLRMLVD